MQVKFNVEKTENDRGLMFSTPLDSFDHWISSLPHSHLPLLDLGCAYGANTFHAMRAGRDVIASDMDPKHLEVLQERVKELTQDDHYKPMGRLIDTKEMTLPCSDGMEEKSVSGILLSEVLHFFRPGEPEEIMKDAYKWLDVGGVLVVTSVSLYAIDHPMVKSTFQLDGGHSSEEVKEIMKAADEKAMTITKKDMERIPPLYMVKTSLGPADFRKNLPYVGNLLLLSIANLSLMAREAGFEVVEACYISPKRYPKFPDELDKETALLIARKPFTE